MWNVVRKGSVIPGFNYSGIYVEFRNPETGHIRNEFAQECHGSWMTDFDTAASVIGCLTASADGYLPYRAVLVGASETQEKTWEERDVVLVNNPDAIRHARERAWRN